MRRYVLCSFRASDMGSSMKIGDLVKYGIYLGLVTKMNSGSVLVLWCNNAPNSWFSPSTLEIVNESR